MNNSPQYPLQVSHWLMNLCELASLNMVGSSSNPIKCANQDNERKDPSRGMSPQGNSERKESFKSKCDNGMCLDYSMAYGVIQSISMSAFV
jgi:hypothetical protein